MAEKHVYEDYDDARLHEIWHSTDYTTTAREHAHDILLARGFSEESIAAWRDDRLLHVVPLSTGGRTERQILRAEHGRLWLYRSTVTLLVASLLLFALGESLQDLASTEDALVTATVVSLLGAVLATNALCLHLIIHGLLWLRPARILVLRPFHSPATSGLRALVKRHVRCFGHIYTLHDELFRPSGGTWWMHWSQVLVAFRHTVRNEYDVIALQQAVGKRFLRNLNWAVSLERVFAVVTSDEWWQRTVQALIHSSDVIIVDLSERRGALEWELNELSQYKLRHRSIVIAASHGNTLSSAGTTFLESDGGHDITVFYYDGISGVMPNVEDFRDAIAACIARGSLESQRE